jgi:hypothetical protein
MNTNKMIQRIFIGLVSFFILALIGLNIYEYMKVVRPSKTINSEALINYNTEFGSAQAKENSTAAIASEAKTELSKK